MEKETKITWQFCIMAARKKMSRQYQGANPENKCKRT
jgi:hypothetical protein